MSIKCKVCGDYGIVIVEKTFFGNQYKYAFICDCWAGIGREENYPSIKDRYTVQYSKEV